MTADLDRLTYWLSKNIFKAIRDYDMIRPGDRVAVALSGGKDSFSLLRLLDYHRKTLPQPYDLVAIHILGDSLGPSEPHTPLVEWLESSGFDYAIEPLTLPEGEPLPLDCRRCTWNRRKVLFQTANRLNCNVLAFGHHADDLAQTTLLNLLYHGTVETMAPVREYFGGLIRVIRPLCATPERDLRRYASACGFPPPPPLCPRSSTSRRKFVSGLIAEAEKGSQDAKTNLIRAGLKGIGFPVNKKH